MAADFDISVQLALRGPANIKPIVQQLQTQLNNFKGTIDLKFNKSVVTNINSANTSLGQFNTALKTSIQTAGSASQAFTNLAQSLGAVRAAAGNIKPLQQQINQLSKTTVVASNSIEDFGKKSALALRRFAAFTIPTASIFGFVTGTQAGIRAAVNLEREFVRLSQVTGKSLNNLRDIQDTITNLGRNFGVSSTELSKVATTLAQAGLSAQETKLALDGIGKSTLLATFNDINNTTESVIAAMNQFGIKAEEITGFIGTLNAVSAAYAVEAEDLSTVIRKAGGAFASAGGNLNELLALFTSVRSTTRESADSIATGFRTIFARIQRPQTIEFLRNMGIELTTLDGKFVGPLESIRRLSEGLRGLQQGDLRLAAVAEEVSGIRQISKFLPLITEFEKTQQALNIALSGSQSLTRDVQTSQQALLVQVQKLKEEYLDLFRTIVSSDSFKVLATSAIALASSIAKITESLIPLIPLLTVVGGLKLARLSTSFGRGFLGFAGGGKVPGSGNTDSVHALLTPGEFVFSKPAVNKIGINNLKRAHSAARFASGGLVGFQDGGEVLPVQRASDRFIAAIEKMAVVVERVVAEEKAAVAARPVNVQDPLGSRNRRNARTRNARGQFAGREDFDLAPPLAPIPLQSIPEGELQRFLGISANTMTARFGPRAPLRAGFSLESEFSRNERARIAPFQGQSSIVPSSGFALEGEAGRRQRIATANAVQRRRAIAGRPTGTGLSTTFTEQEILGVLGSPTGSFNAQNDLFGLSGASIHSTVNQLPLSKQGRQRLRNQQLFTTISSLYKRAVGREQAPTDQFSAFLSGGGGGGVGGAPGAGGKLGLRGRFGSTTGLLALAGVGLVGDKLITSLNPNEGAGREGARGALSGGLSGAAAGFLVGGPIGAAVGGVVGALAGFSTAFDETTRNIQSAELDRVLEKNQKIFESLNTSIGVSQKQFEALNESSQKLISVSAANIINQGEGGNVVSKSFNFIKDSFRFQEREASAAQRAEPAIQEALKQAEVVLNAQKASFGARARAGESFASLRNGTRFSEAAFNAGLLSLGREGTTSANTLILQALKGDASARNIALSRGTSELERDVSGIASGANTGARLAGFARSVELGTVIFQKFADAAEFAVARLDELEQSASDTRDIFSNTASVFKLVENSVKISFGGPGNQAARIRGVATGGLANTGLELNAIKNILPAILEREAFAGAITDDPNDTSFGDKIAQQLGGGTLAQFIGSRLTGKEGQQILDQARINPLQAVIQAFDGKDKAIEDVFEKLTKSFLDGGQKISSAFLQAAQFGNQASAISDTIANLGQQRGILAAAQGGTTPSLRQLTFGARATQARLFGGQNGSFDAGAINQAIFANRAQQLNVRSRLTALGAGGQTSDEGIKLARTLADLTVQGNNLAQAQQNLIQPTEILSAIQTKLAEAERQRSGVIGSTERGLGGTGADRADILKNALLGQLALQRGSLQGLSARDTVGAIQGLRAGGFDVEADNLIQNTPFAQILNRIQGNPFGQVANLQGQQQGVLANAQQAAFDQQQRLFLEQQNFLGQAIQDTATLTADLVRASTEANSLAQSIANIPKVIEHTINGNLNVNINGLQALTELTPAIQAIVRKEVAATVDPDRGPRPIAAPTPAPTFKPNTVGLQGAGGGAL